MAGQSTDQLYALVDMGRYGQSALALPTFEICLVNRRTALHGVVSETTKSEKPD